MKKIIIIGRPYSNGGDYLIYHRIEQLIKKNRSDVEISLKLGDDKELSVMELNQFDAIVTGGGGAQFSEEHIRTSFIFKHFDEILVPIHFMGTGLYGKNGTDKTIFSYKYSNEVVDFFNKIIKKGGQVASRDWVVDMILRNNGIRDTIMTGCPAWYDIAYLEEKKKEEEMPFRFSNIKYIAISNHGLTKNPSDHDKKIEQMIYLISLLRETFKDVKLMLTFNDGYITKYSTNYNIKLKEWAEKNKIICVDLSNKAERFEALNKVDFHVGFRVHTHIYCLSRGIPSLLIEEDIRGYGMNESLHLPHITAYDAEEGEEFKPNPYLSIKLMRVLEQLQLSERIDFRYVSQLIWKIYIAGMQTWINKL